MSYVFLWPGHGHLCLCVGVGKDLSPLRKVCKSGGGLRAGEGTRGLRQKRRGARLPDNMPAPGNVCGKVKRGYRCLSQSGRSQRG